MLGPGVPVLFSCWFSIQAGSWQQRGQGVGLNRKREVESSSAMFFQLAGNPQVGGGINLPDGGFQYVLAERREA